VINTSLVKKISSVTTVLIGENHGVIENTTFVKEFVDELHTTHKIKFVGFEYPIFALEEFRSAVKEGDFQKIKEHDVSQMLMRDGRFSKFHFELLKHLDKVGIPFIFFDSGRGTWDDRDLSMYENIQHESPKYDGQVKLIVAGNIHTMLQVLNLNNKPYKPLGTYFDPKEVLLLKLKYHSGEFFNFSRRQFEQINNDKSGFEELTHNEYLYHILQATPTQ
jgi:hypothetical protein